MTRRAGEWRARLVLAIASTLLSLAVAEVAARLLLRPPPPREPAGTPISELSSTLGWRTRPLGSQRIRREDFEVTVTLNRFGLRGPEVPYEPAPGRRRLAIMGDSFAHGYYAEEPETVRGRLGQALDGCGVDVLNAGGPGYSTDQTWIYFDTEIRKYDPREVVLLFYYNDLSFNIERMGTGNREKPVFVERGDGLELVLPGPAPEGRERRGRRTERATASVQRRSAPAFHGSALWGFTVSRLQVSRPDWSRTLSAFGLAPELSVQPPPEFLPFGPIDGRERGRVEEMWKRTTAILGRFRDDVRAAGAGFSVFYVPSRFEASEEAWRFVQRRYEPDRPWTRDVVRTRLESTLASLDIPMFDTTDVFRAAEAANTRAYLAVDGHWNARGNEIAAASLLPAMRRAFSCGQ
jgi:SGNH hydrolase-like domain, acetyltransferase AlgX